MTTPSASPNSTVAVFITQRRRALGLSRKALVQRLGYAQYAKGERRLQGWLAGSLTAQQTTEFLPRLAQALECVNGEMQSLIDQQQAQQQREQAAQAQAARQAYIANFQPHGYLLGSRSRPSPLAAYALTGGNERWLKVAFAQGQSPMQFSQQMRQAVKANPDNPFWGKITGFYINYTPHQCVQFDANGNPVALFDGHNYHPGQASLLANGRPINAKQLTDLFLPH